MIAIGAIFFISGLLQGMTSFGFSLIALPLLGLVLDIKLIVPVLVIYSFIMNTTIIVNLYKHIKIKEIIWIAFFGMLFTPIGMQILLFMDGELLKMLVGLFIFGFSILLFFNKHFKIKNIWAERIVTGGISGILNGSVSFSGPPMVIFLSNKGVEKQQFRANLTFYFWILNVMTIPTFIIGGLITSQTIIFTFKYVGFLLIGVIIGVYFGNRLKENVFKRLVIIVLMVLGIMSFISSLNIY
jgi:uncharacterized membrane protein YfcA